MKLLLINAVCGIRSTGRICTDIAKNYKKQGYEVKIAYGRANVPIEYEKDSVKIGNVVDVYWHALMSRVFADRGYWSKHATKVFLQWADKYDPDILWLHNIHDYYINIEMLFKWIKKRPDMEIKWTHHDCWAFTGYCAYFSFAGCEKWKKGCINCPKTSQSKIPLIDNCKRNLKRNKQLFSGVNNMVLITPSEWLASLLRQSFLNEYKVIVRHNSIDTSIFKPTDSYFREKYNIENKFIILGVAFPWSKRKGFEDFLKLARLLDERYVIVLVGLSRKQIKMLPEKIIGLTNTDNVLELVRIYSTADIFLNLTYEDNYPTTNLEAQACGTPCITYATGGSPESVPKENVVPQGNIGIIAQMIFARDYSPAIDVQSLFQKEVI